MESPAPTRGSPLRDRLESQLRCENWADFRLYHEVFRDSDWVPAYIEHLTSDKAFAQAVQSALDSRPYGLAWSRPILVVWRPSREPGRIVKLVLVAVVADLSPVAEFLSVSGDFMPAHLQKWAYMFFRDRYGTWDIILRLEIRRAKRMGLKLPELTKDPDSHMLRVVWHPSAPICAIGRTGYMCVCTRHGYWHMPLHKFCSKILPLRGSTAELQMLMTAVAERK